MSEPSTIAKKPATLGAVALKRADIERGSFIAIVPSTTTFEDVMRPSFWQHHAGTLGMMPGARPYARVEVVREDGTMDLDLRVLQAKQGMVRMLCLRKYLDDSNLTKAAAKPGEGETGDLTLPEGYKWTHVPNGQNKGHMVRLPNGEVLVQGLPSKAAAAARARAHFAEANATV